MKNITKLMLYVFLNITLKDIIISNHCQLNLMFWFQESSCILLIYLFSLNYQDWDKFLWSMHVMSTHYQFFFIFLDSTIWWYQQTVV